MPWDMVRLGKVLERIRRPVSVQPEQRYREIGIRSHGKGIFYKEEVTGAALGNKAVFWVEPDCFVLNIVFAWEQAIARTSSAEDGMIASHRFPMYRPKHEMLDLDYLVYFFKTSYGKHLLGLASPGGAGRNKTLGQHAFLDIPIPLPSLAEQRETVTILATCDQAAALTERLIEAKRRRKTVLMQHLLLPGERAAPRVRLPGFDGEWPRARLGDLFARVTRKNTVGNTDVLTASARQGLVRQTSYFGKNVAGAALDGYYLLRQGEFAYNRSRSDGYPLGAIKCLSGHGAGIVSTLYICFRLVQESADPLFYAHFFEAGGLNRGIYGIASEGGRAHGLLNVRVWDFFNLRVPVPPLEEQRKLSRLFSCLDEEIALLERKLALLREQKKGLMQRLLAGEVRVTEKA